MMYWVVGIAPAEAFAECESQPCATMCAKTTRLTGALGVRHSEGLLARLAGEVEHFPGCGASLTEIRDDTGSTVRVAIGECLSAGLAERVGTEWRTGRKLGLLEYLVHTFSG